MESKVSHKILLDIITAGIFGEYVKVYYHINKRCHPSFYFCARSVFVGEHCHVHLAILN